MQTDTLQIVKSKSGSDTLTINSVYIHSKYNPTADGNNQKYPDNSIVVVFGIGLGYHIVNLTAHNPKCFFIVYEIHQTLLDRFVNQNSYKNQDNVLLLNKLHFDEINNFMEEHCKAGGSRLVFYQNPYCNLYPEICLEYQNFIKKIYELFIQNLLTKSNFTALWSKNLFYNVAQLSEKGFATFNHFEDSENLAVIICAGPTLTDSLGDLQQFRDKITIFAVDSALKPLLKKSVVPDFVFTVDGQMFCFDDFPADLSEKCTIISDMISYPPINRGNNNQLFTINSQTFNDNFLSYLFEMMNIKMSKSDFVNISGTVSDYALNFVVKLGFRKIVFIGLDLSYPNFVTHLTHSPVYDNLMTKTGYFNDINSTFAKIISKRRVLEVQGKNGETLFSDFVLNNYAEGFSAFAAGYPNIKLYNVANKAMNIPNIDNVSLKDLLHTTDSENQKQDIMQNRIVINKPDSLQITKCLEEMCSQIYEFSMKIKNLYESIDWTAEDNVKKWETLFNDFFEKFSCFEKFTIMDEIVFNHSEKSAKDMSFYRSYALKQLQSCYYIIRTIQKSLKIKSFRTSLTNK